MPLPGHAPKSGAISAVNAAATFSSVARQAKAAGINRDELREELGRLRNQPGAGAASAVVAASTGQRTSVEAS
ncbi:unnamed protein product [Prorocentrum cordatum]|uniref:Uncharacterized protein n=1 Tax=Prorocentrum cordatum TaxID=2364126 RepID=A0ABN9VX74_9DINO|nr:unnamed protein product [Polarella glacialis]